VEKYLLLRILILAFQGEPKGFNSQFIPQPFFKNFCDVELDNKDLESEECQQVGTMCYFASRKLERKDVPPGGGPGFFFFLFL